MLGVEDPASQGLFRDGHTFWPASHFITLAFHQDGRMMGREHDSPTVFIYRTTNEEKRDLSQGDGWLVTTDTTGHLVE